ncbi:MAG: LD-carboxypeptidase [Ignavibacteriales bacterium]|jgi:muramoyltetrapeptide carboxypeptidase|nr:MAG: LD-carboxypeptidase [Ignavibacteriales bacterium]
MKILKPKRLQKGDVIGIISPASSPLDSSLIEKGTSYLERLGYKVEIGKSVGKVLGYLAGSDAERLNDIHSMFRNKNIKAVFSLRGGYGSARLLDKLDYNLIRKNNKIFVGFSDITALQLALYHKAGIITFAGPMVATNFSAEINSFSEEFFWDLITKNRKIGKLKNPNEEKFFVLNNGRGEGKLLGGNLSTIISIMGSKFFPSFRNSILMLEEINEPPYKIDRMFNQLRLANIFNSVKGIILGRFVDCYETDKSKNTLSLNEIIVDYFKNLKIPVIYNVQHGHISDLITLPIGINTKLNASKGFIEIAETGVL